MTGEKDIDRNELVRENGDGCEMNDIVYILMEEQYLRAYL